MENMATKKKYLFKCGRWLATDEEDHEIVREIPAEGESIRKPEPRKIQECGKNATLKISHQLDCLLHWWWVSTSWNKNIYTISRKSWNHYSRIWKMHKIVKCCMFLGCMTKLGAASLNTTWRFNISIFEGVCLTLMFRHNPQYKLHPFWSICIVVLLL